MPPPPPRRPLHSPSVWRISEHFQIAAGMVVVQIFEASPGLTGLRHGGSGFVAVVPVVRAATPSLRVLLVVLDAPFRLPSESGSLAGHASCSGLTLQKNTAAVTLPMDSEACFKE